MTPRVSVLMPVFNGAAYLHEALDSIRAQSFTDWELVVVDDGSTDASWQILAGCSDTRIRCVRNPVNRGLSRALNLALEHSRGALLARQDSDDVSFSSRLETQLRFLDAHPQVGIVGSAARVMSPRGRPRGVQHVPASDLEIRWVSLLENPFVHTSVMLRAEVLRRHNLCYDESFTVSQDYDLWTRLLDVTRGANLPRPLVRYRLHAGGVTGRGGSATQNASTAAVATRMLSRALPGARPDAVTIQQLSTSLLRGPGRAAGSERARLANVYLDLLEAFMARHPGHEDLPAVRRLGTLRVAALLLASPLHPRACARPLARALKLEPGLPKSVLRSLPAALARRARRFLQG